MGKCDYCRVDLDGFVRMFPREGTGNAYIRQSMFDGPSIEVYGPRETSFSFKIKFCPMCGRELWGDTDGR